MEQIKLITGELIDALGGNVNDNFLRISFEIVGERQMKLQLLMQMVTEVEEELVDDFIFEFEALDANMRIDLSVHQLDADHQIEPLTHLVYAVYQATDL